MSDVRLTWELQEPTSRQRPLEHIRVDFRVSADLPWTEQDRVSPDGPQELLFQDVAPGTFFYRVTPVDDRGTESPFPAEVQADIDFDAPSGVVNLVATVVA